MNIISEKEVKNRLSDGIETIFNLSEEEFNQVIEGLRDMKRRQDLNFYYLTDSCEIPNREIKLGLEAPYEERGYYGGKRFNINCILAYVDKVKGQLKELDKVKRANSLLATRDLEAFKNIHAQGNSREKKLLDRIFEMLGNQMVFEAFLDFEHHKDEFAIEGQEVEQREYLKYLGAFFGTKDREGNLSKENEISTSFYIPQLEGYKQRYSEIFEKINIDRFANPEHRFEFHWFNHECDRVIRRGEEPKWNINEELHQAIYQAMPKDLTLEEQAMYIYCKLLEQFSYDEGYFYQEHLEEDSYSPFFSKEHLEGLKPKSKVTCWDFARVFAKLINELEGEIEGVIVSKGINEGHFCTGFYTDKVSVMLEAISAQVNGLNDLVNGKRGIELKGIQIISDRENIIPKAIEKVYAQVFGKQPMTMEEYLTQLRALPQENAQNEIEIKLQSFMETMQENRIAGNEATQLLKLYQEVNFFGEKLEMTYLGRPQLDNNKKTFERMIVIRQEKEGHNNAYLLATNSLELSVVSIQKIGERLKAGEFVYEDEMYTIPNIGRGEDK